MPVPVQSRHTESEFPQPALQNRTMLGVRRDYLLEALFVFMFQ